MKRKALFILLIIIEMIIVCYFSATKTGWNFMKDIVLGILILNIVITVVVIFIAKKSKDTIRNDSDKLKKFLMILIIIEVIVIVYEAIYTQSLVNDVVNMYSASFLDKVNSFDELYDALNISAKEKKILINNDDALEDWYKEKNSNPLNYVIFFTPFVERMQIEASRIIWLSNINNDKKNYKNSFEKYKAFYSNVPLSENDPVNQIKNIRNEYIKHLVILFIVTAPFEILWLFLLIKLEPRKY